MKFKSKIPKDVDPIELADKIKKGLTSSWLKRYNTYFNFGRLQNKSPDRF